MAVLGKCIRADDPRTPLERMKKRELVEYAHINGQTDISADMPADDYKDIDGRVTPGIRSLLQQRGLRGVRIDRRLGQVGRQQTVSLKPAAPAPASANPTDSEWEEFQQWKAFKASRQAPPPAKAEKPKRLVERPKSEINRLRDECKARGIKMDRRDNMDALRAKIEAAKSTDGQDPPRLRQ